MRTALSAARLLAVLVVSFVASARAAALLVEYMVYEPPRDPALEHSQGAYDTSRVWLSGAPRDERVSSLLDTNRVGLVALALRAEDAITCEDLGAQVRRLRYEMPGHALMVWTPAEDSVLVSGFLRAERIADVRVLPVAVDTLITGTEYLATPAAFLVEAGERALNGVSHRMRFRNIRLQSFAEEIAMIPDSVPQARH